MEYQDFYTWMIEYKGLATKSAYLYTRRITRFKKLVGPIESFSENEIYEYVNSFAKSIASHNSWVGAIKKYEEYLEFIGNKQSLSGKLKGQANNHRLPKPFTEKEIDEICSQISTSTLGGKRDRAIIELLYCGLRNSEACGITFASLEDATALVMGKGSKERYVPINDVAWYFILDYILLRYGTLEDLEVAGDYGPDFAFVRLKERLTNKDEQVFLTSEQNKMYPRAVRDIVYKYAERAGVQNAHPHRFRHSFATHTLDSGLGNLTALKDVLGHSKFDMVQRYVLTTKVGRERVKSFHPRQRRETTDTNV